MSSTSAWLKRILRGTKFIKIRIQGNELDQDPLGWSRRMVSYHRGEFSMAAVQANRDMEDLSQVEVGRNALFVGIYDGLVGDTTSTYISNHLFPTLLSESSSFFFLVFICMHACVSVFLSYLSLHCDVSCCLDTLFGYFLYL